MAAYDRAVTIFSPDGRLLQVEYAQEASKKGSSVVAVCGEHCILMAVEKRAAAQLQIDRTLRKICALDEHIIMSFAGLSADARILIQRARIESQSHRLNMDEPITVEQITKFIALIMQKYTQSSGMRPFGVTCIVGGFDDLGKPRLFQTEPSGVFYEWRACSTGRSSAHSLEYMEKHLKDFDMSTESGVVKFALRSLLDGAQVMESSIELAMLEKGKPMRMFTADEIAKYVAEINTEKKEEEMTSKQRPLI